MDMGSGVDLSKIGGHLREVVPEVVLAEVNPEKVSAQNGIIR